MTSFCSSNSRPRAPSSPLRRARGWLCGGALLAALGGACGGQSLSTDTGNPPVAAQKLHLTATATGVVVTGDPGAVPGGARVDVVNTATARTASTTAAADGSFELELEGEATDEYRVYVGSGQQSWRTRLTSSGSTEPETGIEGRDFLLSSAQGFELVANTSLRVSFSDGELSFYAGCNSAFGAYSLCDGSLCVTELATTDIGCGAELHEQDTWLADFFSARPQVELAGATLTLRGADATLELLDREVADPERPLAGRIWQVDTFLDGAVASGFPLLAKPPTLEFQSDGTLAVFDACNTGYGTFSRSGQTLNVSSVSFTELPCPGATQEQVSASMHAIFMPGGEFDFAIEANRLTLLRGMLGLRATTD